MFEEFYEMYEPEEQEVVALINRCIGGGYNWKGKFWEMTVVTLGMVFCDTGKVSTKEERLDWPVSDEERNSEKGWGRFGKEQICRLKIRRMKEERAKDLVVRPWSISEIVNAHEDCPELQAVLEEYHKPVVIQDQVLGELTLDKERYSIGWRMGYGEDYIDRFGHWLDTLSPEERAEYRTLFPEPVTWKGWWEDEDTGEVLVHGDFLVEAWQPEGRPKYTRQWLQQEFAAGRKRELCLFWGHQPSEDGQLTKSCLSQWWMEDFYTTADSYLCMEQYMMAAKAELFGDKEIRDQILKCSDQKQIKALGRKVRGFDQKVWDKFKYAIVLLGNWHKFSQNRELREFLLSTGDSVLVEASPYDAIWGIRLAASSPEAQDPMKWRGQNLLGFALMEVRDELRRVTQNEMLCDWSMVWQQ